MDYSQALEILKGDSFPSAVIIQGEEKYLVADLIQKIIARYIEPGMEEVDVSFFSGENLEERDLFYSLSSPSFFSEKRIAVIRDAQKFAFSQDNIKQLKSLEEGLVVVFLPSAKDGSYRRLTRSFNLIDCRKISRSQMHSWINKEMRNKKKRITPEATSYLIDQSKYFEYKSQVTLYYLKSELDKLASLEADEINLAWVESLMQASPETNVFLMIEHLSKRNRSQVFRLYSDYLASGASLFALVPLMVRNYYQLLSVKVLQERGIPLQAWNKNLGIGSDYVKKKLAGIASQYSRKELLKALDLCLEKEALYKSQSLDIESLIQNLILDLLHI